VSLEVAVFKLYAGAVRALGDEPDLDLTGEFGLVSICHCGLMSQLNTTRSAGS
jgi:hypothetical protein